ncbi:MAG: glycosyltransferase family 4 protein [Armatimonadota bacterium]
MKILMLYEYPPTASGLATQGDLMYQGLQELGVDVHAAHFQSDLEKEWYYRWFQPDLAVGIGFWGYAPQLILNPQRFRVHPVPWLVADGYIANYRDALNNLPLLLVTSNWVRDVYIRDGIRPEIIEVLPVGCDTEAFTPRLSSDPSVAAIREALGVKPDQLMILTIGGDTASKGGREVMEALARIDKQVPDWRYVCKGWSQERTTKQNQYDLELAVSLGIEKKVIFNTNFVSRNCMPYLMTACDIYAGPSRLEGFGMPHMEAGACAKPVLAIDAMAFNDTLVHGETALLAGVAEENWISETTIYEDAEDKIGRHHVLDPPRIADYRASVDDIADHLLRLMTDSDLRRRLGEAGRKRVSQRYGYRVVANELISIVSQGLNTPMPGRSRYTGSDKMTLI